MPAGREGCPGPRRGSVERGRCSRPPSRECRRASTWAMNSSRLVVMRSAALISSWSAWTLPGLGLAERGHDIAAGIAGDVIVHLEAVAGEDRAHRGGELRRAGGLVARADDHLVVLHPAGAAGVAVEEQRVAVGVAELAEQAVQGRVVRDRRGPGVAPRARRSPSGRAKMGTSRMVWVRTTPRRERTSPSVCSKSSRRRLTSTNMRENGRGQHGGAVLVQIAVEIAREGVGEAVGEGLEPRLAVVVPGDVGQGLGAVVGHADQDGRARPGLGVSDDREGMLHRLS